MGSLRQRIRGGIAIAVLSIALVLGAVPQRYIPKRLTPFVAAEGRFAGTPVRLAAPEGRKSEVSTSIRIQMDAGVCRVSLGRGDELTTWFSMGSGSVRQRIPAGSELVLDPQGNPGRYEVTLGPPWHPLAPKARRLFLLPAAIGAIVVLIFARRIKPLIERLGAKRLFFLIALCVLSGMVLYPVIHEGGHLIAGMLFGATPDWDRVTWTPLSGEEPRASFSHLPEGARPWMSAGGPIVPTLFALLLLVLWRFVSKKASWYVSAVLVTFPVLFLFSTIGCLLELNRDTHMNALALHFGLTGIPRVLFSLSLLFVAIAVYVWLGLKFRASRRSSPTTPISDLSRPRHPRVPP